MAIATAYTAINMNAISVWYGTPTIYNSTHIQINAGLSRADYYGTGCTFGLTGVTGGTLARYDASYNGVVQYSITGLSLSAVTVNNYLNTANANGLLNYAFAGDDTLNGSAWNDTINGYNGNDIINGNGGNDVLSGGAGADRMTGGTGNDTYVVDNALDVTIETSALAAERDTVLSSVSRTLGANLENLTLTGAGTINGTGNALNNILSGNAAANILSGGLGSDILIGGAGNDILTGGAGRDTLTGGAGTDRFDFNLVSDSVAGINRDVICDFVRSTDKINLYNIDAIAATAAINDAFAFTTGATFTAAGQVRFANGIVYGNTDANLTTAEFEIALTGITSLSAADFVL